MRKFNRFELEDVAAMEPTAKIGLLATVNPQGLPHLTLITSIQALDDKTLVWGQFTEGLSKRHVRENDKTGFLVMTLDKVMRRGTARFTKLAKEGPEYEMYNSKPMFRYNTYFGINTVYYMDLLETCGREKLPLPKIAAASVLTKIGKGGTDERESESAMNAYTRNLFGAMDSLKFVSWIDNDGFPVITPLIQCQAANNGRLVFSPLAYSEELAAIPQGAIVAVFGMTTKMEDVLVRGIFKGFVRRRLIKQGVIDVNWVYNSMPTNHGQIYPPLPLKPITDF